jgi:hypothetical protein
MENQEGISDTEFKQYISTTYAELFSIVAESGLRYFETTETYAVDGSDSYFEPDNHMSTVGMDRIVNAQGERRELTEIMAQERNRFAGLTGEAVAFAFVDDQVYFYPNPSSGTYELIYVQQPPDLSDGDDADNIDVVTPDGEAFILWGVAVQALAKEGSDVSIARAEREEARERVFNWATLRSLNSPRRRNVASSEVYTDPADYWGRGGSW